MKFSVKDSSEKYSLVESRFTVLEEKINNAAVLTSQVSHEVKTKKRSTLR